MEELLPLEMGRLVLLGEATSTGKEDASEFRGSMSPALSGSSHRSLFQVTRTHSFPTNALTLIADTL